MGTKMTNGAITIEVFSDVDMDFYKRAGYVVVDERPTAPPEQVEPAEEPAPKKAAKK
jgi:hypothetical protein